MNYNMLSQYGSKNLLQGLPIRDDNQVIGFKMFDNLCLHEKEKKRSLWILSISVNIHKAKYLKFFVWILLSIKLFLSYRIGLFSACTIPNTYVVVDVVVVQSLSHVQLFATKWTVTCQAPLSFTTSRNLLKFMSIVLVMLSSHLILCQPPLFQSFPASGSFPTHRLFASGGQNTGASA